MKPLALVVMGALALALVVVWRALRARQRADFIRAEPLPQGLYAKLKQHRPALTDKDCQLVGQALRQFFLAYLKGGRRTVAMPSQVADELWHEFILHTRAYERFCRLAFGGFLHHTPAVALSDARRSNEGLRRVWWHACRAENIHPRQPARLPLLFAVDAKLAIEGGFRYVPDCGPLKRETGGDGGVVHCGGDFASAGFDGGTDGLGDPGTGDGGADAGGGSSCSGGGCSSSD